MDATKLRPLKRISKRIFTFRNRAARVAWEVFIAREMNCVQGLGFFSATVLTGPKLRLREYGSRKTQFLSHDESQVCWYFFCLQENKILIKILKLRLAKPNKGLMGRHYKSSPLCFQLQLTSELMFLIILSDFRFWLMGHIC